MNTPLSNNKHLLDIPLCIVLIETTKFYKIYKS